MADDQMKLKKKLDGVSGGVPSPMTGTPPRQLTQPDLEDSIYNSYKQQASLTREPNNTPIYLGDVGRKSAEERLDRSEELAAYGQLASQIGNSLTKLFAAQTGLNTGVDLSKVDTTTPDFKQFLDSASRKYKAALDDEARKENLSMAERDRNQKLLDQQFADAANRVTASRAGDEFLLRNRIEEQKTQRELGRDTRDAANKNRELGQRDRALDIEQQRADQELEKARAAASNRDPKMDRFEQKEFLEGKNNEIKSLEDTLKARQGLISTAASLGDLSSKERDKAVMEMSKLAERAGMGPTEIKQLTDAAEDANAWRFSSATKKEKQEQLQNLINSLTSPVKASIDQAKRERDTLITGRTPVTPDAPVVETPAAVLAAPRELSAEDTAALNWARSNPADPRAVAILRKLGLDK